jgi:hypothetical protein
VSARTRRVALLLPVMAATSATAGFTVAPIAAPVLATQCGAATWSHHVALVVEHGNGSTVRLCIGFDAASISGADVLSASGLEVATTQYGSLGNAVCQIDHEPATYPPGCWTATSDYWAMFVSRRGGAWQPAAQGIASEMFAGGDAEGFRYEAQTSQAVPPSPARTCTLTASAPTTAAAATSNAAPGVSPAAPRGATPSDTASSSATPGVAAVPQPPVLRTGAAAGVSPGLLGGIVAAGALLGLLGAQLAVRRRRR